MFEEHDTCLKKMIFELAQAINCTISESTGVQDAIEAIKEKGYEIDVSLAACIGLHKPECSHAEVERLEPTKWEPTEWGPISLEFNQRDLAFLKSLKIRLDEN